MCSVPTERRVEKRAFLVFLVAVATFYRSLSAGCLEETSGQRSYGQVAGKAFPGLFGARNLRADLRQSVTVFANGARTQMEGRTSPWMIQFETPAVSALDAPPPERRNPADRKMAASGGWTVELEPWKGGAKAAMALTFDDGYKSHATVVAPLLRSKGFNATFYLITAGLGRPGKIAAGRYGDWNDFDTLAKQGFEIGSHTYSHKSLSALPLGDSVTSGTLRYELSVSHRELVSHFPYLPRPLTLGYPFQKHSAQVRAEVSKYFLAARADGSSVKPGDLEYLQLPGIGVLIPDGSDSLVHLRKFDSLGQWVDNCLVGSGSFQTLVLHEVLPYREIQEADAAGSAGIVSLDAFGKFLDGLRAKVDSGKLWVGSVRDIVRYQKAWEATTVDVRVNGDTLVIESRTSGELPGEPAKLSLKVQAPPDRHIQLMESGAVQPVQDSSSTSRSFLLEHIPGTVQKYRLLGVGPN